MDRISRIRFYILLGILANLTGGFIHPEYVNEYNTAGINLLVLFIATFI